MEDIIERFHAILINSIPERYGAFLESISIPLKNTSIHNKNARNMGQE